MHLVNKKDDNFNYKIEINKYIENIKYIFIFLYCLIFNLRRQYFICLIF